MLKVTKGKILFRAGHEVREGELDYSCTLSLTSTLQVIGGRPRPRPFFLGERDPVPILQKGGWALGPMWKNAENLASTGIRSPDRGPCSDSL
jgi:hypothetical protein